MEDIEPTNLCATCKRSLECFEKGISVRETCDEYEPWPLEDLLKRDKFLRGAMVGACPRCGSESTYDCENNPLLEDNTVGHCLDCEAFWCLECSYIFKVVEKGVTCPHWDICDQCSEEHGYLDIGEFVEKICPTCEFGGHNSGCRLEDPSKCEKQWQYRCPYDLNISECPKIIEFLEG